MKYKIDMYMSPYSLGKAHKLLQTHAFKIGCTWRGSRREIIHVDERFLYVYTETRRIACGSSMDQYESLEAIAITVEDFLKLPAARKAKTITITVDPKYKWKATDKDGEVWLYVDKPTMDNGFWYKNVTDLMVGIDLSDRPWKDTLQELK